MTCGDRMKIFWESTHFPLFGNQQADRAAKPAACATLIMDDIMEKWDFQRCIGRNDVEQIREANLHHYHRRAHDFFVNPRLVPLSYSTNIDKLDILAIIRFGHKIATHQ